MAESLRRKVVEEILATEATYLRQLDILEKFFVEPSREKEILPPPVHHTIFGGLAALHHVSQELYRALLPAGKKEEEDEGEGKDVGSIFLELAPFLKAYSSYVMNYQGALDLLLEWEARSSVVRQWVEAAESRPEVQTKLPALLITPVQRIPRYLLLLGQLLQHTPAHHPHHASIARAVQEVECVARFVDSSISEAENHQRVLMIQRALKGTRLVIVAPGRRLLKEGVLHKMSSSGSTSHPRLCFLFSDVLIYTKMPSGPSPLTCTHRDMISGAGGAGVSGAAAAVAVSSTSTVEYKPHSLDCCCVLPLRHCVIIPLLGSGQQELFRIKCESEDLIFYTCPDTAGGGGGGGGGGEWVAALRGAVEQAIRKRRTLRKESSSRKPIRKPDLRRMTRKDDDGGDGGDGDVNNRQSKTSTSVTSTNTRSTSTKGLKSPVPSLVTHLFHQLSPTCAWLSPKKRKSNPSTATTITSSTSSKSLKTSTLPSFFSSTCPSTPTRPVSTPAGFFSTSSTSSTHFNTPTSSSSSTLSPRFNTGGSLSTSPAFSTFSSTYSTSSTSSSTSHHPRRRLKRPHDVLQGQNNSKKPRHPFSLVQSPQTKG